MIPYICVKHIVKCVRNIIVNYILNKTKILNPMVNLIFILI